MNRLYGKSYLNPRFIQSPPFVPVRKSCPSRDRLFPTGGYESGLLGDTLSIAYQTAAWKIKCPTALSKSVLICLADHYNFETGRCFPSIQTIAKRCDMHRTTAMRAIKELETAGILIIHRSHKQPNKYAFTFKPEILAGRYPHTPGSGERPKLVAQSDTNRNRTRKKRDVAYALSGEPPKSTASQEELDKLVAEFRNSVA